MTYFQKKLNEHAKCIQKIKLHEIVLRLNRKVKLAYLVIVYQDDELLFCCCSNNEFILLSQFESTSLVFNKHSLNSQKRPLSCNKEEIFVSVLFARGFKI